MAVRDVATHRYDALVGPGNSVSAVADLTLRLIAEPSPFGQEARVASVVCEQMTELGFDVEVDALGNVIGTLDAGPGPCILLDSHMDTVGINDPAAWTRKPSGEIDGTRIYGRGAMDMKGPLAASIFGAARCRNNLRRGRVVVAATIAEELVEGPALAEVARTVRPDQVIICEATGLALAIGQRGRAEILVEVAGKATHSSRPDLGVNAAEAMADVIAALRDAPMPDHSALRSGVLVLTDVKSDPYPGLSVVPDRCFATFDRRLVPGESVTDVLEPMLALAQPAAARLGARVSLSIAEDNFDSYTGAHVSAPNFAPAWFQDPASPLVAQALASLRAAGLEAPVTTYSFCTNGSGTAQLGIPTLGFGPGDEQLAHRADEFIEMEELERAVTGYSALIQSALIE
jgi:putative selenium metabolism hydrolase